MNSGFTWSDAAVARLAELAPTLSAHHIALRLADEFGAGISRNAVVGKAGRAGIALAKVASVAPVAREGDADGAARPARYALSRQQERGRKSQPVNRIAEARARAKAVNTAQIAHGLEQTAADIKAASPAMRCFDDRMNRPAGARIDYLAAGAFDCRWVYDARGSDGLRQRCGEVREAGRSYCPAHLKAAAAPAPARAAPAMGVTVGWGMARRRVA